MIMIEYEWERNGGGGTVFFLKEMALISIKLLLRVDIKSSCGNNDFRYNHAFLRLYFFFGTTVQSSKF